MKPKYLYHTKHRYIYIFIYIYVDIHLDIQRYICIQPAAAQVGFEAVPGWPLSLCALHHRGGLLVLEHSKSGHIPAGLAGSTGESICCQCEMW